jgi:glycosyltransferase involved in cell wall biosynthesis
MLRFLEQRWPEYRALVFVTYLYPTTYFGLGVVPGALCLLVPTLHDEPPAYLPAFRWRTGGVRSLVWLTHAEQRLGHRLWGERPGRVTAMPVCTTPVEPATEPTPYVLYCGRITASKGCDQLVEWFLQFKRKEPSPLRLVLTGEDKLPLPKHPDLDYRGFVTDEQKRALMAGAAVFVMPSPYESFSLATLEAMAQCTPVLVRGECEVLADHARHSGGGVVYRDRAEFEAALRDLPGDDGRRAELGGRGREYVLAHFQADRVRAALIEQIEGNPAA